MISGLKAEKIFPETKFSKKKFIHIFDYEATLKKEKKLKKTKI